MVTNKKLINFETRLGNEIIAEILQQESDEEYIISLEEEIKNLRNRLSKYEVVHVHEHV